MRLNELSKSMVAAIKHYSHRQNVDSGTTGEARAWGRAEEIVKFRRVVGSDWLEYIYNV